MLESDAKYEEKVTCGLENDKFSPEHTSLKIAL